MPDQTTTISPLHRNTSNTKFSAEGRIDDDFVQPNRNVLRSSIDLAPETPQSFGGLRSGIASWRKNWLDFGAAIADSFGSDRLRDDFMEKARRAEIRASRAAEGRVTEFGKVKNVVDFGDYLSFTLGSMTPFALESVAAAISGGVAGLAAKKVARKAVMDMAGGKATKAQSKNIANIVSKLANEATRQAPVSGAGIARFGAGFKQGAGEIFGETGTSEGAFSGAVPFAALEFLGEAPGVSALQKFTSNVQKGKAGIVNRLARGAAAAGAGAPAEALTEAGQTAIVLEQHAKVDPTFNPNSPESIKMIKEAGIAGFFGGGTFAGAAGLARSGQSSPLKDSTEDISLLDDSGNPDTEFENIAKIRSDVITRTPEERNVSRLGPPGQQDQSAAALRSPEVVAQIPQQVPEAAQIAKRIGQPDQISISGFIKKKPKIIASPRHDVATREQKDLVQRLGKPEKKKNFEIADKNNRLPKTLRLLPQFSGGRKPVFSSDIDRALFALSRKPKNEVRIRKFLNNAGLTDKEISTGIEAVASEVDSIRKGVKGPGRNFNVPLITDLKRERPTVNIALGPSSLNSALSKIDKSDLRAFENEQQKSFDNDKIIKGDIDNIRKRPGEAGAVLIPRLPKRLEDFSESIQPAVLRVAKKARAVALNSFEKFKRVMRKALGGTYERIKSAIKDLWDKTGDIVTDILTKPPFSFRVINEPPGKGSTGASPKKASENKGTDTPDQGPEKPARPKDIDADVFAAESEESQAVLSKFGHQVDESSPESVKDRIKDGTARATSFLTKNVIQGVFDRYHRLKLLDMEAMAVGSLKEIKKGFSHVSSYMQARMAGTANQAVTGMFLFDKIHLGKDGAISVKNTDNGLTQAIDDTVGQKMFPIWIRWHGIKRAANLKKEDRENWFTDKEIKRGLKWADGTMELNGKTIPRRAAFEKMSKIWQEHNKAVVDVAVGMGYISQETANIWLEQGDYLPFYRVIEKDGSQSTKSPIDINALTKQRAIHTLKGAEAQIGDPFENAVRNWTHLLSASLHNRAGAQAMEYASTLGYAEEVNVFPGKNISDDVVWVWENGVKKHYKVLDGLLLESLSMLNENQTNNVAMQAFRMIKKIHTTGVTANPAFMVANLMRDSLMILATTDVLTDPVRHAKNVSAQVKESFVKEKSLMSAQLYVAGGDIDFGYLYGGEPETATRLLRRGVNPDTVLNNQKSWRNLKAATLTLKGVEKYMAFGNTLENLNRKTVGKSELQSHENLFRAAFEMRDVMDFGLTGSYRYIRFLAQSRSFFNARLQGIYKLGREVKDNPKRFFSVTMAYAIAGTALYAMFRDRKEYQELEEWDKDTYHHFWIGKQHFRLAKPFEMGVIQSMMERSLETAFGQYHDAELLWKRAGFAFGETLNLGLLPQALTVGNEVWANKSNFTGRPIEGLALQRLLKTERSKPWTSFLAIGASKATAPILPEKMELSPVQIEHLVYGYLGWVGSASLDLTDFIYRNVTSAPDNPSMRAQDFPLFGRFVRGSGPQWQTKYKTEFYETNRRIKQVYYTINELRRAGRIEEAAKLAEKNKDILAKKKAFAKAERQLSKIRKSVNDVHRSDMDAVTKRQLINNLTVSQNRILELIRKDDEK